MLRRPSHDGSDDPMFRPAGHSEGWSRDDQSGFSRDDRVEGLWADEDRNKQRRPNFLCWGLALSLIMGIVLVALSGIRTEWTLNAGESRRIETPILQRNIIVSSSSSGNSHRLDAMVYDLDECPPLTGPPVTFQDYKNVSVAIGAYEYDYFFLNKGSNIDVQVEHVSSGEAAVYVL